DVFTELDLGGNVTPLEPGMGIQQGPSTTLQGASGTLYQGTVTPIDDLSLLPTSNVNDTQIVWDLSRFNTTTGNFYLVQYDLPNAFELTGVPEPSTLVLVATGIAGLLGYTWTRREQRRIKADALESFPIHLQDDMPSQQ